MVGSRRHHKILGKSHYKIKVESGEILMVNMSLGLGKIIGDCLYKTILVIQMNQKDDGDKEEGKKS